MKKLLAINPWIHDFAAYDLWLKPLGFLHLLGALKEQGVPVNMIDCLDRFHPVLADGPPGIRKNTVYGCGKFSSEEIPRPTVLAPVPRAWRRYGTPRDRIIELLKTKRPDAILVSSSMTYWYPGVFEMIALCRDLFGSVPILLGGTYATLCTPHARRHSGADYVFTVGELPECGMLLTSLLGREISLSFPAIASTSPDYSFYPTLASAALRTSWGCPFRCDYCASNLLTPERILRDPALVISELTALARRGVKNIALYDDAFLHPRERAIELLESIIAERLPVRFHTPNGLHMSMIDAELARLLKEAHFVNPRFGIESFLPEQLSRWDGKLAYQNILEGIRYLREAGYREGEFTFYLSLAAPQTGLNEVREAVLKAHRLGALIHLAEFSAIPGTKGDHPPNASSDPLFGNNSLFSHHSITEWQAISDLKQYAARLNRTLFPKAAHVTAR